MKYFIILMIIISSCSFDYNNYKEPEKEEYITITGYILQIGNSFSSRYIIINYKNEDERYVLPNEFVEELDYNNEKITISGIVKIKKLTTLKEKKEVIIRILIPDNYKYEEYL